jgi:hypothetical protein
VILSVMRTPSGNLVELRAEDGVYTTHLYLPAEDGVREIGVEEAKEWQKTVRRLQGELSVIVAVDAR